MKQLLRSIKEFFAPTRQSEFSEQQLQEIQNDVMREFRSNEASERRASFRVIKK